MEWTQVILSSQVDFHNHRQNIQHSLVQAMLHSQAILQLADIPHNLAIHHSQAQATLRNLVSHHNQATLFNLIIWILHQVVILRSMDMLVPHLKLDTRLQVTEFSSIISFWLHLSMH